MIIVPIILVLVFGYVILVPVPGRGPRPKPVSSSVRPTPHLEETSEELTERLRRQEAQQKQAEKASWEREFQEKLNEAFMPPVPKDYLEVPLNKNTTLHDEPSKWSPRRDVPKDTLIEIDGFVRGDEVQGNPIWYFDKKSKKFFSSSDVDTHPRNLPQFRNEPRDITHIRDGGGYLLATAITPPMVLSPMTKNPMYLGTPDD